MRRRIAIAAALGAATAILLAGRFLSSGPTPRYATVRVTRGDIENTVLATGTVQAIRQVDVGTRVTGQLTSLKVRLGDHVRAGQPLAEIDPALPESELRAAEANLAKLEAQRASAIANSRRSKLEFDRQRRMIVGAVTSRREFESAEAQALSDAATLKAFDAEIAEARSRADIAAANLAYTKIAAPIDGDVVGVLTQEGQTVVAAQIVPVLLKLARLDAMTVRTQVSEADVIDVKVGQKVSFTIMGDPDTRHSGVLRAVEPAPPNYSDPTQGQSGGQSSSSSTSGTSAAVFYNALFDVPNPDRRLRIGMTAQVSITLGVRKGVLTVPASVLREQRADGLYAIRVIDASRRLVERQVRIGVDNHVTGEVLEGLAEGETVVLSETRGSSGAAENSQR